MTTATCARSELTQQRQALAPLQVQDNAAWAPLGSRCACRQFSCQAGKAVATEQTPPPKPKAVPAWGTPEKSQAPPSIVAASSRPCAVDDATLTAAACRLLDEAVIECPMQAAKVRLSLLGAPSPATRQDAPSCVNTRPSCSASRRREPRLTLLSPDLAAHVWRHLPLHFCAGPLCVHLPDSTPASARYAAAFCPARAAPCRPVPPSDALAARNRRARSQGGHDRGDAAAHARAARAAS